MKFKSKSGSPVRIALLSGHVTIVTGEFQQLNEIFHSEAYSLGCVSEDMIQNKAASAIPLHQAEAIADKATTEDLIIEEFKRIVEENDQSVMTKSGPDARHLTTIVGKRISTSLRNELWYKFQQTVEED